MSEETVSGGLILLTPFAEVLVPLDCGDVLVEMFGERFEFVKGLVAISPLAANPFELGRFEQLPILRVGVREGE